MSESIYTIITKAEARAKGLKRYFTGKPCKHDHLSEQYIGNGGCVKCHTKRFTSEENNRRSKMFNERRPEYAKERSRLYGKNNREQYLKNNKKWRDGNPHKLREYTETRNGYIKIAKPLWADDEKIKLIYQQRDLLTEQTGIVHHVDHVIPLMGENVCGLHVENNLCVLTIDENLTKSNSYITQ